MKLKITKHPFGRVFTTLTITIASALATIPSYASESEPPVGGPETKMSGLDTEQQKTVAKAGEEQAKKGYSKQEETAIDLAISKLNEKIPVSRDTISNIRIRSIQWPDSSLGCAEPGVEYLQVVTPGYLVNFKANEKIYTINVGGNRAIICDRINDFMLERKKRADLVLGASRAARLDLAEKLMVDPKLVKIIKIKPETWSDSSLGCPHSDNLNREGPIEGLRINMTCKDKQY